MFYLAIPFFLAGLFLSVLGSVRLILAAFRTSIPWGICYLFVPFASLVWTVQNWEKAKRPFAYFLGGLLLCSISQLFVASANP